MKNRYRYEAEQAAKEPPPTEREETALQRLSQSTNVCDPTLIPVSRIMGTSQETWDFAAKQLGVKRKEGQTFEDRRVAITMRAQIKHKATSKRKDIKAETVRILSRERNTTSEGYPKRQHSVNSDLVTHKLSDAIQINNINLHPINDLQTIEQGHDMNDNCLDATMQLIANKHNNTFAVNSGFSIMLRALGWHDAKVIIPPRHRNKTLLIPIHTGGSDEIRRHWSLLIRQPKGNNEGTYDLYYYDSLNDSERAAATQRLTKGNLYNQHNDKWHNIRCSYQIGRTCGAATALNAAAAMEWPADMGERIQEKLQQIPNRDVLSRAWVKACLHQKSVVSLQWINDETARNDSNTAPHTPGTFTPAAKRHQRDANRLSDMSTTPTAPKPTRLEFTLPRPNNKRNDRFYKTPTKSTNDGKRATNTDDHTPVQIKEIKEKLGNKPEPKHTKPPKQCKIKPPPKSMNKAAVTYKKRRRGAKGKKHHERQKRQHNDATTRNN